MMIIDCNLMTCEGGKIMSALFDGSDKGVAYNSNYGQYNTQRVRLTGLQEHVSWLDTLGKL